PQPGGNGKRVDPGGHSSQYRQYEQSSARPGNHQSIPLSSHRKIRTMTIYTFSLRLAIYTVVLICCSTVLASLLFDPDWIFTQLTLSLIILLTASLLVRHVFKTERELGHF